MVVANGQDERNLDHGIKLVLTVGLAIVKTLNRHTRILEHHGQILERIDRKLDPRWNGRPGRGHGRTE